MNKLKIRDSQSKKVIFLCVLLFFLGLIVGLIVPFLANPRMCLSSHLEGIMNGIFLIVLGLIWNKVDVSVRWLKINFWLAVYGTFANWLGILVAAMFNAGKMLNVAAEGQQGPALAEGIVNFSLISLTVAMLAVCIILLIGLGRQMRKN